jgi:hypothetical protein
MQYLYKFVKLKCNKYIIRLYENITLICDTTDFKYGFIMKK